MAVDCPLCPELFSDEFHLKQHLKFYHNTITVPTVPTVPTVLEDNLENNKLQQLSNEDPLISDLKTHYEILTLDKKIRDLNSDADQQQQKQLQSHDDLINKQTSLQKKITHVADLKNKIKRLEKNLDLHEGFIDSSETDESHNYWCDVVDQEQNQLDDFYDELEELEKEK